MARPTRGPGPRRSTEPLVALNARVPSRLWRRVRILSVEQDWLVQDIVADALREYLAARTRRRR